MNTPTQIPPTESRALCTYANESVRTLEELPTGRGARRHRHLHIQRPAPLPRVAQARLQRGPVRGLLPALRRHRTPNEDRPRPAGARRRERPRCLREVARSEEHTSELQSLMRISYAVFCLKKKNHYNQYENHNY